VGLKVNAVIDAGPLIHLREIGAEKALSIFDLLTTQGVVEEVRSVPEKVKISNNFDKNLVAILQNDFSLGLGECQCIALAKAEKIPLLLTDDLDARTTALSLGLEPHGTVGIILKAYRSKVFSKSEALSFLMRLKSSSTLYITSGLIKYIVAQIEKRRNG